MSEMHSELSTVFNVLTFLEESVKQQDDNNYSEYGCRGLAYIISHLRGRLVHAMEGEHLNFTDGTSDD